MATIDFGGVSETVIMRSEFPVQKAQEVLKDETVAIIGYGVQGPAQALNMKDNGIKVIIGQAKEFQKDWDRAVEDGWVPGETLFDIAEATSRGTIIQILVSDGAQRLIWSTVKENLNKGDALYFSHGFSITYAQQTGIVAPDDRTRLLGLPGPSGFVLVIT